jgi:trans-aconitate methyltransferase
MQAESIAGLSFGKRGGAYKEFRLDYPAELVRRIIEAMPDDRREFAIDLGAGTGHTTKPLIPLFDQVMAIEPDAVMAGKIDPASNLSVQVARSEDAEVPRKANLVTCGTAFYWMDGPLVLQRIAGWLEHSGLAAIYRYALPEAPAAVHRILEREMAEHWDAHRNERLRDEEYTVRTVSKSNAFTDWTVQSVPNRHMMTAESFVGFFGSTSYVGAYMRSIGEATAYLTKLTDEVAAAHDGAFEVDFPIELVLLTGPQG